MNPTARARVEPSVPTPASLVGIVFALLANPPNTERIRGQDVQERIRESREQAQSCYDESGASDTEGVVRVEFRVGRSGKPTRVQVYRTDFGDRELHECLVRVVQGWRFDKQDSTITVKVPFVFRG